MVTNLVIGLAAGFHRLFDHTPEFVPGCVFQQGLQVACQPILASIRIELADALEGLVMLVYIALVSHVSLLVPVLPSPVVIFNW